MTDRGRHARRSGVGFYRDVLFLIAGILIVGAVVFGGLSIWAGQDSDDPGATTTTDQTTSTTEGPTTTPSTTATSLPTTATSTTTPSTTEPAPNTTAPTTTVREARDPSEVTVQVLNSTTVTGLAAEVTDELAALGYQTIPPTNYTPELSDSMIFHADGFAVEALAVGEAIPDGTVAPDSELTSAQGVDIVVVIGRSYQG